MVQKVEKIWMDGKFVNWDDANVHILTHTLHYGLGIFEGVRCYKLHDGRSGFFRLRDHLRRFNDSAKMYWLKPIYSIDELVKNSIELYHQNKMKEGYLRPLMYIGSGAMGLHAIDNPLHTSLIAWEWGKYLGDDGFKNGIRAKISSISRLRPNINFVKAKAGGNYPNSILAKREAMQDGYHEAIMLDTDGYVAEASGENIFVIRDGIVRTPPATASILNGITRDSVIQLLRDDNIPLREEKILREELYVADEIFFTGTAAEVTPVREIDHHMIGDGKPGPITTHVKELFFDAVRGKIAKHHEWLEIF
ncbi:MAG TPA: branched-chain amino acid transaminase [bacterium]|nr:branched-chain amino acid transaminase [bacterium]